MAKTQLVRPAIRFKKKYFDFSKAFDSLNHNILIRKLSNMGISKDLTHFFKSYLTDRKQYIAYNGFKSTDIYILFWCTSGVCSWTTLV